MRHFKTTTALLAVLVLATGVAFAERGDDSERKSKNGMAEGMVDGVSVKVEYGRPNVKGREIFGELVPYGKVWRTGADEATTITFGGDVMFGSAAVSAGTYSLFTIPGEKEWSVVLNSTAEQWGAYDHEASADVAKIPAMGTKVDLVETMTITVGGEGLEIAWADTSVSVPIAAK